MFSFFTHTVLARASYLPLGYATATYLTGKLQKNDKIDGSLQKVSLYRFTNSEFHCTSVTHLLVTFKVAPLFCSGINCKY